MVDLLSVIAQATLPGAITSEDPSIFQYLLIESGQLNVREERERQTRNNKGSKGCMIPTTEPKSIVLT